MNKNGKYQGKPRNVQDLPAYGLLSSVVPPLFVLEKMNQDLFKDEQIEKIRESFQKRVPLKEEIVSVLTQAYPLVVMENFLEESFAHELKTAVETLPFKHKATDLFDMQQSPDLKPFLRDHDNPISRVCHEIYSQRFTETVSRIIGKPIDREEIDFAAQKYCQGQYLLCHDDRVEGRRVAFVLYLVDPSWSPLDGGQFEKYPIDQDGNPLNDPIESFTPAWNTMVFFEVSRWSHHQVAEVLGNLPRLSVAGWLHDPTPELSESKLGSPSVMPFDASDFIRQTTLNVIPHKLRMSNRAFTHLELPFNLPFLLDLIDPNNPLYSCHPKLDGPSWPVYGSLSSSKDHIKDFRVQEHDDAALFVVCVMGSGMVNGRALLLGELFMAPTNCLNITTDNSMSFLYWSFRIL